MHNKQESMSWKNEKDVMAQNIGFLLQLVD